MINHKRRTNDFQVVFCALWINLVSETLLMAKKDPFVQSGSFSIILIDIFVMSLRLSWFISEDNGFKERTMKIIMSKTVRVFEDHSLLKYMVVGVCVCWIHAHTLAHIHTW